MIACNTKSTPTVTQFIISSQTWIQDLLIQDQVDQDQDLLIQDQDQDQNSADSRPRPRPRLSSSKTKTKTKTQQFQHQDQDQDFDVQDQDRDSRLTRPILEGYDWDKLWQTKRLKKSWQAENPAHR